MSNYKKNLLDSVILKYGFEDKRTIKFARFLQKSHNIDTIMSKYKMLMT